MSHVDRFNHSTERFAEVTSHLIARHTSRRGFLVRAAIIGSAMVTAPLRYVLEPGDALATCINCNSCGNCKSPCPSGCTDGTCQCNDQCCNSNNSVFCCTLPGGSNECPGGSSHRCGSWFCGDINAYEYIDCCQCPCGAGCHCGDLQCYNRRTCCFAWSWSNCNRPTCNGSASKIVCRVTRLHNANHDCSDCTKGFLSSGDDCANPPACAQNPPSC